MTMIRTRTLFLLALLAPGLAAGGAMDDKLDSICGMMKASRICQEYLKSHHPALNRKRPRKPARGGGAYYAVTASRRMPVPPPARLPLAADKGGLVRRVDGAAAFVPPAALPLDLEIGVAQAVSEPARETAAAEKNLKPASLPVAFGPEGTAFSAPVTITISYDSVLAASQGLRETDLKVHYWNHILRVWEALASRVNASEHLVSAEVRHFSVYQVLGSGGRGIGVAATEAALGFKAAYVFPNPVRGRNTVTIRAQPGLADSVEVRVYDLSGRKVHASSSFNNLGAFDDGNGLGPQFTYDHVWDASGMGSGVYTYVVTAKKAGQSDIVKTGKLGIVK